jgi:hypothetical protein
MPVLTSQELWLSFNQFIKVEGQNIIADTQAMIHGENPHLKEAIDTFLKMNPDITIEKANMIAITFSALIDTIAFNNVALSQSFKSIS